MEEGASNYPPFLRIAVIDTFNGAFYINILIEILYVLKIVS